MGWSRLQYQRIAERKQFIAWLTAGHAENTTQMGHHGHYYPNNDRDNRAPAPWNLRLFGELGISEIMIYRPRQTTYPEDQIRKLFPEADLIILRPTPMTKEQRAAEVLRRQRGGNPPNK